MANLPMLRWQFWYWVLWAQMMGFNEYLAKQRRKGDD